MRKTGLFAGALSLLAASTGAQAFEVKQYLGFADGSLEAIRAHMAAVQPDATAVTDRIDFSDYGDADGEFPGTAAFPASEGATDTGGVNDNFVMRATGSFVTETPGRFVFKTRNDDAAFVLVDGKTVIADGNFHPPTENWGEIALQPGTHSIEVYFVEVSGGGLIELSNERPEGGYDQVIEGGTLFPKYPDAPARTAAAETAGAPKSTGPAAAPAPERTLGMWSQVFEFGRGSGPVSLVSTPEAALLLVGHRCHAVFAPAGRFAAMEEQGNDCNPVGAPFVIEGTDGKDNLMIRGRIGEREYTFPLRYLTGPDMTYSTLPAGALDLAGVTLGPSVADMMDRVSASFAPAGDPPPKSAFYQDAGSPSVPVPDHAGWMAVSGSGSAFLSYASPDADPRHDRDFPENAFLILSHDAVVVPGRGFFGGDSRPWGLVRFWGPAETARPTLETLYDSLQQKYGPASWTRVLGGNPRRVQLVWSFDPQGEPLDAQWAEYCSGARSAWPVGVLVDRFRLEMRTSSLPDPILRTREGCGVQFVVGHAALARRTDPVRSVVFSIHDPRGVLVKEWEHQLQAMPMNLATARRNIAAAAAGLAERRGRQPDL